MDFLRNNWWYILLVGAMAYMMFRGGGCCGGHSHGGQGEGHGHGDGHGGNPSPNTGHNSTQMDMVKDPVCGMYVDPDTAIREVSNGQAYFFCSESCRSEFLNMLKVNSQYYKRSDVSDE